MKWCFALCRSQCCAFKASFLPIQTESAHLTSRFTHTDINAYISLTVKLAFSLSLAVRLLELLPAAEGLCFLICSLQTFICKLYVEKKQKRVEYVQYINEWKWHVLSFLWRISSKPATRSLRHLVCLFHLSFPRSLSLFSHSFALMLHFSSVFFSFLVVYLKLFLRKIKTHYEGLKMLKANKMWLPTNPNYWLIDLFLCTIQCFDLNTLLK